MLTAFTALVGCQHPVQQAAMGGVAGPELAGAVAAAGALGMLCEFDTEPSTERITQALALAGGGAIGIGFFGHCVEGDLGTFEEAAARLRVLEVFWSDPDPAVIDRARRSGPAKVAWQVGSVDGACAAIDAGCDFVIVQGIEAGGHVRGSLPRDELLDAVLSVASVPVIAAGGIANAAQVARIMAAGAAGVRVGTRFVATTESRGHPVYLQALVDARSGEDTVLTTTFSGGWPDAPHRVLRSAVVAAEQFDGEVVGHVVTGDDRAEIPRFGVSTPGLHVEGAIEAMALYAGTGVGDVPAVQPAGDIVRELVGSLRA